MLDYIGLEIRTTLKYVITVWGAGALTECLCGLELAGFSQRRDRFDCCRFGVSPSPEQGIPILKIVYNTMISGQFKWFQ